jgi:predicted transcriptional regulator
VDHGSSTSSLPVASFIRRAVISCRLSDSIGTVLRLMNEHEVRHLPVIEEHGLVGVISATDLIRHYLHEEEAELQPGQVGAVGAALSALR